MYQLNIFKKKLTEKEVIEMYDNGWCSTDRSSKVNSEVVLSWKEILRKGAIKGNVTMEESKCYTVCREVGRERYNGGK